MKIIFLTLLSIAAVCYAKPGSYYETRCGKTLTMQCQKFEEVGGKICDCGDTEGNPVNECLVNSDDTESQPCPKKSAELAACAKFCRNKGAVCNTTTSKKCKARTA